MKGRIVAPARRGVRKDLLTPRWHAHRMRIAGTCLLMAVLAACNGPGPAFHGIAPDRAVIGGAVFDIRVKGRRAQAIRLNSEWAPRLAAVAPRAIMAIETVSGCRVAHLDGDQAVVTARLDCGDGPPPPPPIRGLDCAVDHLDETYAQMTCVPIR